MVIIYHNAIIGDHSSQGQKSSSNTIVYIILGSLLGASAILAVLVFFWYRNYGKDGKESLRRQALKRLPIHSALVKKKSDAEILSTIELDEAILQGVRKSTLSNQLSNTSNLKDFDGQTVLDLCLKDRKRVSKEVVLAVLLKCLPFDMEQSKVVTVPPEKHVRSSAKCLRSSQNINKLISLKGLCLAQSRSGRQFDWGSD